MIKAAFAPQRWQPIIDLLRPAIRIWPKRSSESPIASRYGGLPAAPRSWKWPRLEDEEPLVFLAQINCAELGSLAASLNLPNQGILSFFGHPEDINGAGANGGAVYFFKDLDKLALRRSPIKEDRPPITCDMSFYETNEVPDPASAAFKGLGITREHHRQEWDSYYDLYMALARFGFDAVGEKDEYNDSKLLGWPNLVQNEFDLSPYRLLLQLGSYHDGTERCWWGPGGLLYFTMKPEHLARFEFNRAELEVQCT